MNLDSFFTVKNDRLGLLDEHEAVDFFKKLLWAEASRIGIEISNIHVPSAIHVPDGGVDAAVDDAQIAIASGIIKPGKTSYQIKSGWGFKPWQKLEIKRALFGKKDQINKTSAKVFAHVLIIVAPTFWSAPELTLLSLSVEMRACTLRNTLIYALIRMPSLMYGARIP